MAITAGSDILASDFVSTSAGAGDSGKVAKLNATGTIDRTFLYNTLKFGGDGSDGALTVSSGTTNIDCGGAALVIKNYSSVSITGTGVVTFSNPHANGTTVIIRCQGNATLTSSATPMLDLSALGAIYGASTVNSSTGDHGTDGKSFSYYKTNKGTGAQNPNNNGGAVASFDAVRINQLLSLYMSVIPGAGGGSGNSDGTSGGSPVRTSGRGGRGGGALIFEVGGALNFTTANGISVAGENGAAGVLTSGAPADWASGGGGGGGGGVCLLLYNTLTAASGTVNVSGGTGGNTGANNSNQANGGGGGASVETAGNNGTQTGNGAQSGGNGAAGTSLITKNLWFV